jgi:hypothetical protein
MSKYKVIVRHIETREFVIESHNAGAASQEAINASEYQQGDDGEFLKVIEHPDSVECEVNKLD